MIKDILDVKDIIHRLKIEPMDDEEKLRNYLVIRNDEYYIIVIYQLKDYGNLARNNFYYQSIVSINFYCVHFSGITEENFSKIDIEDLEKLIWKYKESIYPV